MSALQWQLARDAAHRYETVLVRTYLGRAAEIVVNRASPSANQTVVDVGCGTGAAARLALSRVGPHGRVIGIDVNRYMLQVSREIADGIEFREGDARQLPLRDGCADAVICSNTLQFVPERARAMVEMVRVLRPRGRLAIGVWEELDRNPYFEALSTAIATVMGPPVASAVASACALGSASHLWSLVSGTDLRDVRVDSITLDVKLGPLTEFVPRHIAATPMAGAFRAAGDEAVHEVVTRTSATLGQAIADGATTVPFRLLLASGHALESSGSLD